MVCAVTAVITISTNNFCYLPNLYKLNLLGCIVYLSVAMHEFFSGKVWKYLCFAFSFILHTHFNLIHSILLSANNK